MGKEAITCETSAGQCLSEMSGSLALGMESLLCRKCLLCIVINTGDAMPSTIEAGSKEVDKSEEDKLKCLHKQRRP